MALEKLNTEVCSVIFSPEETLKLAVLYQGKVNGWSNKLGMVDSVKVKTICMVKLDNDFGVYRTFSSVLHQIVLRPACVISERLN